MNSLGGGYNPYGFNAGSNLNQLVRYGAPKYDVPQYGVPQYGNSSYATPQYSSPQYSSPQYGTPTYENPQFVNQHYGNPHISSFGNDANTLSGPMSIFKPFDRDGDGKITENGKFFKSNLLKAGEIFIN